MEAFLAIIKVSLLSKAQFGNKALLAVIKDICGWECGIINTDLPCQLSAKEPNSDV